MCSECTKEDIRIETARRKVDIIEDFYRQMKEYEKNKTQ
jgi:hypothetical protein